MPRTIPSAAPPKKQQLAAVASSVVMWCPLTAALHQPSLCVLVSLLSLLLSHAHPALSRSGMLRRFPPAPPLPLQARQLGLGAADAYETLWMTQTLDHFGSDTARSDRVFQQRILLQRQHFDPSAAFPVVLFYCGNEGDVEWFADNAGWLRNEAAGALNALLVFVEHRYFGQSMPFGVDSFLPGNVRYLSVSQALADYANAINYIKAKEAIPKAKFIAVGGSYGGMLSAWMRMKYPHLIIGALSASGPILQFNDVTPPQRFNEIVFEVFNNQSSSCSETIQRAFREIPTLGYSEVGLAVLNRVFHPCSAIRSSTDVDNLVEWLANAVTFLPMLDYPYPTSFVAELPAWPVQKACNALLTAYKGTDGFLQGIAAVADVFYNTSGTNSCNDLSEQGTDSLGFQGWDYLSCTELVMPMSSGTRSLFPPQDWDFPKFSNECYKRWKVRPRLNWAKTQFGGRDIGASSNIVFSSGSLDPWRGGSIQQSVSASLAALVMSSAAHHLDLRAANPADPPSVQQARRSHLRHMRAWLQPPPSTPPSTPPLQTQVALE